MNDQEFQDRLSRISTHWGALEDAHQGESTRAAEARQILMHRYCGAVFRYLLAAVRDPAVAEDLTQEFALRFIQGRFRHADPARGRFRDYVKTCLFNLVADHRKRLARREDGIPLGQHDPVAPEDPALADESFIRGWREELLARVWSALARLERESGTPYHTVLRFRVEHPDLRSAQLAERLTNELNRPVDAAWVRKTIERTRKRFGELLIAEVRQSLGPDAEDRLEEELADLKLLKYLEDDLSGRQDG